MKITKIDKRFPKILITKGDNTDNFVPFLENRKNKIELNIKKIVFDEKMVDSIIENIKISIKYVKQITNDETVGGEREKTLLKEWLQVVLINVHMNPFRRFISLIKFLFVFWQVIIL